MKILIPILGFAKQGGYRVLSELANAWISAGHECTILVPATSSLPYFPTDATIVFCDSKGISANRDEKKRITGFGNIISIYSGLKEIGAQYDVIFANHSLTTWPVFFVNCADALKVYYIQAYEPGYYKVWRDPVKFFLSKLSYILPIKQFANSKTYASWGIRPAAIIPPGIDVSIFHPKSNLIDVSNKPNICIGTVGRLEPYKGTKTAIDVYRDVKKNDCRLSMRVAFGNVSPASDLEIVTITNDQELADFYRSIDMLLVTCYSQHGAPHYPVIEAMACGTPVVHTNYYPGNVDNSWVAGDVDIKSIRAALLDFLQTSDASRNKKILAAQHLVQSQLSWTSVARQFIDHFR